MQRREEERRREARRPPEWQFNGSSRGRSQDRRLGFIASCFDPFVHPGVLLAMEQATTACNLDAIIIGLHIDPTVERPAKRKPTLTVEERMTCLSCLKFSDRPAIPYQYEADLLAILVGYEDQLVCRILGEDYRDQPFTGDELDIPIFYTKRRPDWSGTSFHRRLQESL